MEVDEKQAIKRLKELVDKDRSINTEIRNLLESFIFARYLPNHTFNKRRMGWTMYDYLKTYGAERAINLSKDLNISYGAVREEFCRLKKKGIGIKLKDGRYFVK